MSFQTRFPGPEQHHLSQHFEREGPGYDLGPPPRLRQRTRAIPDHGGRPHNRGVDKGGRSFSGGLLHGHRRLVGNTYREGS